MQTINWGLVGCGDISKNRVAPALRDIPQVNFISVSRKDADRAESFAHEFGAKKWYADWQQQIQSDEIDAVYIATPVHVHMQQAIAAARAGKHILLEKPMAMNTAECDEIIKACEQHNVKLGIAYYRHFYPVIHRIKKLLVEGIIGKVAMIQCHAFNQYNPQPGEPRYWLMQKDKSGGGPMMDFGCHRIEVMLDIGGPIISTKSMNANVLWDREVEDSSTAIFEFASGAQGILTANHAAFQSRDTLEIYGTKGTLYVENLNAGSLTIRTADGEKKEAWPPHNNFHQPLIEDFNKMLLGNRDKPGVPGETGRDVNHILDEIYK